MNVSPWRIAWAIVFLLVTYMLLIDLLGAYSAADVRSVCVDHSGVTQVVDTTWDAGKGVATVVCRDGWVGQIS